MFGDKAMSDEGQRSHFEYGKPRLCPFPMRDKQTREESGGGFSVSRFFCGVANELQQQECLCVGAWPRGGPGHQGRPKRRSRLSRVGGDRGRFCKRPNPTPSFRLPDQADVLGRPVGP